MNPAAILCPTCGAALNSVSPAFAIPGIGPGAKSRSLAGVLNLLCLAGIPGGIGRLYLGYIGIGLAQLLLTFVCVGYIWSIIDGILMLTGSVNTDADGQPLAN